MLFRIFIAAYLQSLRVGVAFIPLCLCPDFRCAGFELDYVGLNRRCSIDPVLPVHGGRLFEVASSTAPPKGSVSHHLSAGSKSSGEATDRQFDVVQCSKCSY